MFVGVSCASLTYFGDLLHCPHDSVKITGFKDILKSRVDESLLVYRATVVSDDSNFDLSTALFHVISGTSYAVHINASSLQRKCILQRTDIIRFRKN